VTTQDAGKPDDGRSSSAKTDDGIVLVAALEKIGRAFVENEDACGCLSLAKENAILIAEDGNRSILKDLEKFQICAEGRRFNLHQRPPAILRWGGSDRGCSTSYISL
jgi:hypothetical protein